VAAYHVVWECVVEQWLGVRRPTKMHGTTIRFTTKYTFSNFLISLSLHRAFRRVI